MRVWLLGSGSRGNAVVVEAGESRVLVDAGFGPRTLAMRLASIGLAPQSIEAVVLTHEHIDHVKGVPYAARKWGWRVLGTEGTLAGCGDARPKNAEVISRVSRFRVGDLEIETAPTSHDAAESVCVVVTSVVDGSRVGIATDLGVVSDEIRTAVADVDLLVLESNHDPELLRNGPYPWILKRRIASNEGHLSNAAASSLARESVTPRLKQIVLAHLSETNNTPRHAMQTVGDVLRKTKFRGRMYAASQDNVLGPLRPERPAQQLGLEL